jgi:CubicO group peptidase (beta-lactamase class C family)
MGRGGRAPVRRAAVVLLAGLAAASLVACSDDDEAGAATATTTVTTAATVAPPPATTAPVTTPVAPPAPVTSLAAPATSPTGAGPGSTTGGPPLAYPAQPAGVPFPAADWPTAALPAGVDAGDLDAAVDTAFGPADAGSGVRSVVVVHDGAIVFERYHPSVGPDTVMASYSVAKSFTATIVGLLVSDGLLTLDEHPPRPEWPAGDPRAAITLRQLLQMSSGLQWDEVQSLATMGLTMLASPSAASVMAQQPLEREPGTAFEYSTGTSALVAGIAADALGGCAALDDYLHARLLDPLGITTADVLTDGGGCFVGGLGMDMTARDFARFGLLFARGGMWDGEQIVPTTWVDEIRAPSPTNPQYGLHWWLSPTGGEFAAVGLGGQQIAVLPGSDLVVVVNSTLGTDAVAAQLVSQITAAFGAAA